MNAVQQLELESVFLVGRFHRAVPRAVEFLQHLLGGIEYAAGQAAAVRPTEGT